MAGEFEGQVALITGAGDVDGLGFAHACFLAERGAKIVVNDFGGGTLGLPVQGIDPGVAEAAADRIRALGGEAIANAGDVGDPQTAEDMVQAALDAWGQHGRLVRIALSRTYFRRCRSSILVSSSFWRAARCGALQVPSKGRKAPAGDPAH